MRTHSRSGSVDVELEISRVVVRSLSRARRSVRNTKVEAALRIAAGESHVQRRVDTLERATPHIALRDLLVAGGPFYRSSPRRKPPATQSAASSPWRTLSTTPRTIATPTCPAGEHLTKGKVRSDRRDNIDHYRNLTACLTCALKPRCTPDKVKRLKRWEHESVLDKMQARLDHMPEAMTIRRQTVEHPFGTLKAWMGSTHFLTRTLEKVKTEMSLQVLAYNAGLQYEANDQPLRRQPADAGDRGLTARACRRELPLSRNTRIGNHVFTRPRSRAVNP